MVARVHLNFKIKIEMKIDEIIERHNFGFDTKIETVRRLIDYIIESNGGIHVKYLKDRYKLELDRNFDVSYHREMIELFNQELKLKQTK